MDGMKRPVLLAAVLAASSVSCTAELGPPPGDAGVVESEYRPPHFFPVAVDAGAPPPNLFDGWGRDEDDLWYAGEDELLLHWDGSSWRRTPRVEEPAGLDPARGCAPCAVGAGGGGATCIPTPPDGPPSMGGAGGGGSGGAGGAGEDVDTGPPDLRGVWARELPPPDGTPDDVPPPLEIFAAGTRGTVLHGRDGWWTREPVVALADPQDPASAYRVHDDLNDIDGSGRNVVVVGAEGLVAWRNRDLCRFEVRQRATRENLNAVMVRGSDLVAVGNLGAIVTQPEGAEPARFRVAGLVVPLRGIWGPGVDRFYAVGLDGTLLRSSGFPALSITEITGAPRVYLRDVWGLSMSDVFLVGWNGTIAHFDGQTVTELLEADSGERFTRSRLESVLGFRRPPPPTRQPGAPAPPEPPEDALITDAGPVFIGGVTATILRGP